MADPLQRTEARWPAPLCRRAGPLAHHKLHDRLGGGRYGTLQAGPAPVCGESRRWESA